MLTITPVSVVLREAVRAYEDTIVGYVSPEDYKRYTAWLKVYCAVTGVAAADAVVSELAERVRAARSRYIGAQDTLCELVVTNGEDYPTRCPDEYEAHRRVYEQERTEFFSLMAELGEENPGLAMQEHTERCGVCKPRTA